jgi:hypothetical protein
MARRPVLSDQEILARARSVFGEPGYAARTKQIAAAAGLTWGAIPLRFGSTRAQFAQAMAGPVRWPAEPACEQEGRADLSGLLERLRTHLWQPWSLRLQYRLAAALEAHARVVLALLTGDVAQRFEARERTLTADPAFIDGVVRLLSAN